MGSRCTLGTRRHPSRPRPAGVAYPSHPLHLRSCWARCRHAAPAVVTKEAYRTPPAPARCPGRGHQGSLPYPSSPGTLPRPWSPRKLTVPLQPRHAAPAVVTKEAYRTPPAPARCPGRGHQGSLPYPSSPGTLPRPWSPRKLTVPLQPPTGPTHPQWPGCLPARRARCPGRGGGGPGRPPARRTAARGGPGVPRRPGPPGAGTGGRAAGTGTQGESPGGVQGFDGGRVGAAIGGGQQGEYPGRLHGLGRRNAVPRPAD